MAIGLTQAILMGLTLGLTGVTHTPTHKLFFIFRYRKELIHCKNRHTDKQTDRQTHRQTDSILKPILFYIYERTCTLRKQTDGRQTVY